MLWGLNHHFLSPFIIILPHLQIADVSLHGAKKYHHRSYNTLSRNSTVILCHFRNGKKNPRPVLRGCKATRLSPKLSRRIEGQFRKEQDKKITAPSFVRANHAATAGWHGPGGLLTTGVSGLTRARRWTGQLLTAAALFPIGAAMAELLGLYKPAQPRLISSPSASHSL